MPLSFNSIPLNIRTPGSFVEFDSSQAQQGLALWQTRMLILGQALPTGTAAPLVPIQINNLNDGVVPFGHGSMLDRMIRAVLEVNPTTECWAMSVADNPAGVAATFTTTVTGPATGAGTLAFYVSGRQIQVAVNAGDTATTIAANLAAAVNGVIQPPVTGVAVAGVVTWTCKWKGLTGNDIDFRTDYYASDAMPAGVGITTVAAVAGAGNPVIGPVIAALGDTQYHTIVSPWTDGATLAALATEMANRRGPLEMIEGMVYCAAKGSQGALATLGQSQNSPDICIGAAIGPATTWERAARLAGTCAFYGAIDPARPFQTLALAGDIAPNPTERFTRAQRDSLLNDGISTFTVDSGGNVLIERPITTYETSAIGLADTSYLDVNTLLTLAYLRFTLRARIAQKYPRCKLADDSILVAPGQNVVTPKTLSAELVALARDWEAAGLVENIDAFKANLVVERDSNDPSRVNALIPPEIVSGLRIFAGQLQFAF